MVSHLQKAYEKDFYAWTFHNAELLRQGKFSEIDINNVAEELESMGKKDKRELMRRLAVLLAHLLKLRFQSARAGNSWKYTIKEQRRMLKKLLKESPSLKHEIELKVDEAYEDAVIIAAGETGLYETSFPEQCPFDLKECLDEEFFPEAL
jgi:ribosomal protein L29